VFERLGRQRFSELDVELRSILKEKGLREKDPFEEIVARAAVIDLPPNASFEDVVEQAAEELSAHLPCTDEELIEGFMEGTRTGVTPVSHGVALPHMRLAGIDAPRMVLVRARSGIDIPVGDVFGETRVERDTRAIFFLVSPEADPGQHLRLLAKLASQVDDENFLERWLAAPDGYDLKRMFLREEGLLSLTLARGAPSEELIDQSIRELDLPDGCLIAIIQRPGETLVPRGRTVLHDGDRLTIIGNEDAMRLVAQRFAPI
ncbi:MAG: PTS sugar transporter subunit IIA, partial [Planctomycetota bacterium]